MPGYFNKSLFIYNNKSEEDKKQDWNEVAKLLYPKRLITESDKDWAGIVIANYIAKYPSSIVPPLPTPNVNNNTTTTTTTTTTTASSVL